MAEMEDEDDTLPSAAKKPLPSKERRGSAGPRAIAELSARLTRRPLGKRGFTEAAVITEWPAIVGSLLGSSTLPLKIVFPPGQRAGGVLHIRVASGAVAAQLQHLEPLIVQRINGFFGYGAVIRLAISQGVVPKRPPRRGPPPPQLDAAAEAELEKRLEKVEDVELREALASLGRHLAIKR